MSSSNGLTERRRFPHLLKEDARVWSEFLKARGTEFTHFDYDVRVGLGRDPGAAFDDSMRSMALDLSMRRIDVVGYKPNGIVIIEVTRSAGITAIGQLLTYPILYKQTYFPDRPLSVLLVAEEIQTDLEPVFQVLKLPFALFPKRW